MPVGRCWGIRKLLIGVHIDIGDTVLGLVFGVLLFSVMLCGLVSIAYGIMSAVDFVLPNKWQAQTLAERYNNQPKVEVRRRLIPQDALWRAAAAAAEARKSAAAVRAASLVAAAVVEEARIIDDRPYEAEFEEVKPKPIEVLEEFEILETPIPNREETEMETTEPEIATQKARRVAVPEGKHGSTLNSIRTRFEMARAAGPTAVGKPSRHNLAADLAKLNKDLSQTEVPEVHVGGLDFDEESAQIMEACSARYVASKHSWVKESAIEVSKPSESLDQLYKAALASLPKRIAPALLVMLCLAIGAFAQGPQGAGANSGLHLRRPHLHVHLHHRHARPPLRSRWYHYRAGKTHA
jgi:hypothetical protein